MDSKVKKNAHLFDKYSPKAVGNEQDWTALLFFCNTLSSNPVEQHFGFVIEICHRFAKRGSGIVSIRADPGCEIGILELSWEKISQPQLIAVGGPCVLPMTTEAMYCNDTSGQ